MGWYTSGDDSVAGKAGENDSQAMQNHVGSKVEWQGQNNE